MEVARREKSTNVSVNVNERFLKDNECVCGNYALTITLTLVVTCARSLRAAVRIPHRPSPGQVCLAQSWEVEETGNKGRWEGGKCSSHRPDLEQSSRGSLQERPGGRTVLGAHLGLCPVWAWAGGSQVLGAPRSEHLQTLLFSSAPEGGQPNRAPVYKRGERCCCSFWFSSISFSFKISRTSHGGKSSLCTHLQGQRDRAPEVMRVYNVCKGGPARWRSGSSRGATRSGPSRWPRPLGLGLRASCLPLHLCSRRARTGVQARVCSAPSWSDTR